MPSYERTRRMTATALPRTTPAPARASAPRLAVVREREGSRRFINVIVALAGIAVAAPLMAVIAVLVKLTSRGPLLYTQTRVGVDRRNPDLPSGNGRRASDYGGRPF